jgi:hypothetical protein
LLFGLGEGASVDGIGNIAAQYSSARAANVGELLKFEVQFLCYFHGSGVQLWTAAA